jgi:hypothetical protein
MLPLHDGVQLFDLVSGKFAALSSFSLLFFRETLCHGIELEAFS